MLTLILSRMLAYHWFLLNGVLQNRAAALKILKAKLFERERVRLEEERKALRRSLVSDTRATIAVLSYLQLYYPADW